MKRMITSLILTASLPAVAQNITLTIDTWGDEGNLWQQSIIPAFKRLHPDIDIAFNRLPTHDFESHVEKRLAENRAADLVLCKPFDGSLRLFNQGYLDEITEMAGLENFPSFALAPWQTDSGAQTYCLPVGGVIHGFMYNKSVFKELNLTPPATNAEFKSLLKRVKQDGRYIPLALGTKDGWDVNEVVFQNIGPNYWHGEDGRIALIDGKAPFDSEPYHAVLREMQSWRPYLAQDYKQMGYVDYLKRFADGKAAVVPAGSWEIVNLKDKLDLGVFAPPIPDGQNSCYISDHTDKGIGINSSSKHKEAARKLLQWMSSREFAALFTESESGFFSLSNHFYEVTDPVAQEMASWRYRCDSTIRSFAEKLSRGQPSFNSQLIQASVGVMNGEITPKQAARAVQKGLNSWYQPQKLASDARRKQNQSTQCQ